MLSSTKHALNRVSEFIVVGMSTGKTRWLRTDKLPEHPEVKTFSIHPGAVRTAMAECIGQEIMQLCIGDAQLPAWTTVRLATGKDDYLSGRYVSCNWDLDEVASKWKGGIIRDDAMKSRLLLPLVA
ncbi:hypothetical protein DACRYDRAFT_20647 [Dacryopinax primogenitus]|uniref:Uncharacterized protein n=1 Tax=Dacryopinax primogenitus (strain DJM 731) TaxID=1858805 RepID=M5GG96_DACPD|nr:uncharacterized protein DACRYDRAFT_20647 [Dacryopinax primogenitus]EJU05103.1 hypothetical protein DACRYDRAFT_20647 [Dacryopinax primogenitus]